MILDFKNSWKAFSDSCWLWKHFPCKKVVEMLEEVGPMAKHQVNTADEAKLHSPIHQLLKCSLCDLGPVSLWRRIGPFLLTNAGCRHCSFGGISIICWTCFTDVMVLPIQKTAVAQSDQQQTTKQWAWLLFDAILALGSALKLPLSPRIELVVTGCHISSAQFSGLVMSDSLWPHRL